LVKLMKLSKKLVSHSSGPSTTGGGSAASAPPHTVDLFDLGSSAFDAEPTDPVPYRKCCRKSPVLKAISKSSEALFLRSS
jgi:hypothetical protein